MKWLAALALSVLGCSVSSAAEWHFVGGDWASTSDGLTQQATGGQAYAFRLTRAFKNGSVQARFRVHAQGSGVQAAGLILSSCNSQWAYFVHFDTKNDQLILFRGDLNIASSEIARKRGVSLHTGQWYTARAEVRGGIIRVWLDETLVLEARDTSHNAGLTGVYTSQGHVDFAAIEVDGDETKLVTPWHVFLPAQDVRKRQLAAEILETRVLCRSLYIGWPSIAQAPNGDLLAVFSGGRTAHISPDGKVQMTRSTDGGKNWSDAITIYDTPIDDRDSGIIQTKEGAMLVSWFTGPGGGQWQGHWTMRSEDNGHTWNKPVRTEVTTPHGPTQLSDGRILFVGQRPHESHGEAYDVGIQESRDDGRSWRTIGTFPVPKDAEMLAYDECHVVECAEGKLVIGFRDCFEPHKMRQAESTDGGRTWSTPWMTNIEGYPPHLIRLRNNWLVAVYAKRWEPFGQYACISKDNGKTWEVEREIKLAGALKKDMGYPASAELDDGSIWTVYYQAAHPGEKPCLMGTHWRPHYE